MKIHSNQPSKEIPCFLPLPQQHFNSASAAALKPWFIFSATISHVLTRPKRGGSKPREGGRDTELTPFLMKHLISWIKSGKKLTFFLAKLSMKEGMAIIIPLRWPPKNHPDQWKEGRGFLPLFRRFHRLYKPSEWRPERGDSKSKYGLPVCLTATLCILYRQPRAKIFFPKVGGAGDRFGDYLCVNCDNSRCLNGGNQFAKQKFTTLVAKMSKSIFPLSIGPGSNHSISLWEWSGHKQSSRQPQVILSDKSFQNHCRHSCKMGQLLATFLKIA